ncbi:MAG: type IV secretory system conjugative DNA transfer family protein [Alphaproteobacteria bacterium]|nr:type IV secretory system conjugative DNA transfer family protein [Alphaproteobacteria bacterium]
MKSNVGGIPYGYNVDRNTFHVYDQDRHLLTFGPTRSGKGATVIVQALLRAQHSVICIDPKGQNAAITARQRRAFGEVFCLNPFGLHAASPYQLPRHRFNPLAHLDLTSDNVVADVASLSEALIINDGKESHWTESARDLIATLILYLLEQKDEPNALPVTLPSMRKLLTRIDLATFMEDVAASNIGFIAQPAGRFCDKTEEIQSVIATAITQTRFLDDPALSDPARNGTLTGSDFNIRQLQEKSTTVFLMLPGRYVEAYARLFRLFITCAIDQLTTKENGFPTLLMLDEFATLQNLGAISKAFGFAAGYNVQCWAFLQDLPQLKAIYGDKWESFVANAGLLQFFGPADMTTAEYLEKRAGQVTREALQKNYSPWLRLPRGVGVSEQRISLLPPEASMNLTEADQVVFFGGTHSAQPATRKPYYKIDRLNGLWDIDPFHR